MVKENTTFDIAKLTLEEKQIRQKDIEVLFEAMKETKLDLTKDQCEKIYDHMQQGAIEGGISRWEFYQQPNMN